MASGTTRAWWKPSLNWLAAFAPAAVAVEHVPALHNPTLVFVFAAIAIIPVAGWMGHATEQLAHRLGAGLGGLLNASFGNAAELIIALMALNKGLINVVKASITGSIIGNLLLVLGLSLTLGGWKHQVQRFNKVAVRASCTALILAAIGLVTPTVFHAGAAQRGGWTLAAEQQLSLAIAIVLFLTYLAVLWFSLVTHKQLFGGDPAQAAAGEEHGTVWSVGRAAGVLFGATALVAYLAEMLVGAVEHAQHAMGLTEVFVGVIVVAVVGNAAEHATAVTMALKNKMDLSLGIAVGSSLQIALFVAPVLVFASWMMGRPMDLEFSLPEVAAVLGSVYVAEHIAGDGESNWLEGVQLLSVYLVLGILFYFLPH
jgi:Ca2+:H+ antiporter